MKLEYGFALIFAALVAAVVILATIEPGPDQVIHQRAFDHVEGMPGVSVIGFEGDRARGVLWAEAGKGFVDDEHPIAIFEASTGRLYPVICAKMEPNWKGWMEVERTERDEWYLRLHGKRVEDAMCEIRYATDPVVPDSGG